MSNKHILKDSKNTITNRISEGESQVAHKSHEKKNY